MARQTFSSLLVVTLLAASVSGCFGDEGDPLSTPSASATSTAAANTTAGTNTSAPPTGEPEPPVANFTFAPANASQNLTAGAPILFNASASSDPAGGNLSYEWEFGDNGTAQGAVVTYTYNAPGNMTIVLTVTSEASDLRSSVEKTVEVLKGGRSALEFADPSGDGTTAFHDLQAISVSDDLAEMKIKFTVGGLQPADEDKLVVCYNFFFKGATGAEQRYEMDAELGYHLWDYTASGAIEKAKIAIAGTGYDVSFPIEVLEGHGGSFPYAFRMEARSGECTNLGGNPNAILDKAPNTGTVTYG